MAIRKVISRSIEDGAVASADITNATIVTADIADDAVTSAKLDTNIAVAGTLGVTGETTLATHLNLGDNDKIKLGAGGDLQIYHNGNNSYIDDTGTGNLYIRASDSVRLQSSTGEQGVLVATDGAVTLYYDNNAKIATSSSGVSVTGGVTTTTASSIEGGAVFNEASADVDFRVESNAQTHMLFVDGGNNSVGLGSSNPDSGRKLHIEGGDTTVGITLKDTAGTQFGITSDANVMTFRSDSGATDIFRISGVNASIFSAEQTARLNIESNLSSYTTLQLKNNNSNNSGVFLQCVDDSAAGIGGITQASNTSISFNTSSDYRLKENVSYDFDATTRLKQLKPARFNFIADETNTAQDGFLAHEVSDIVPIAITGDKDGTEDIGTVKDADGNIVDSDATELQFTERKKDEVYTSDYTWTKTSTRIVHQQIDHSKLVPLLTKALQEQQATIEALTVRIVTLENA